MEIIREYIPITKAKSDLLNLIRRLADSDDALAITKNGTPEAVLISMKKFTGLLETIDILSDTQAMTSIRGPFKSISWVTAGTSMISSGVFWAGLNPNNPTPKIGKDFFQPHPEDALLIPPSLGGKSCPEISIPARGQPRNAG